MMMPCLFAHIQPLVLRLLSHLRSRFKQLAEKRFGKADDTLKKWQLYESHRQQAGGSRGGSRRGSRPVTPGHFLYDSAGGVGGGVAADLTKGLAHAGVRPGSRGGARGPETARLLREIADRFGGSEDDAGGGGGGGGGGDPRSGAAGGEAGGPEVDDAPLSPRTRLALAVRREELAQELEAVKSQIRLGETQRSMIATARTRTSQPRSPSRELAYQPGSRTMPMYDDWHDPATEKAALNSSTLQSLCAKCGYSYGEHVLRLQELRRTGKLPPRTARRAEGPGDETGRLGTARAVVPTSRSARPDTARSGGTTARTEYDGGRMPSARLATARSERPGTAGSVRPRTRDGRPRPGTAGSVRPASRGGAEVWTRDDDGLDVMKFEGPDGRDDMYNTRIMDRETYAELFGGQGGPTEILTVEEELVKRPIGVVCSNFVPGCLGPAPLFRAHARVREARPPKWQFMNAYNTVHAAYFPVFSKSRGARTPRAFHKEPKPAEEAGV